VGTESRLSRRVLRADAQSTALLPSVSREPRRIDPAGSRPVTADSPPESRYGFAAQPTALLRVDTAATRGQCTAPHHRPAADHVRERPAGGTSAVRHAASTGAGNRLAVCRQPAPAPGVQRTRSTLQLLRLPPAPARQ